MNTTRKHPRTLQEAFGPYTDNNLIDDNENRHRFYDLVIAVIAVAVIALIVIGGTI